MMRIYFRHVEVEGDNRVRQVQVRNQNADPEHAPNPQ